MEVSIEERGAIVVETPEPVPPLEREIAPGVRRGKRVIIRVNGSYRSLGWVVILDLYMLANEILRILELDVRSRMTYTE